MALIFNLLTRDTFTCEDKNLQKHKNENTVNKRVRKRGGQKARARKCGGLQGSRSEEIQTVDSFKFLKIYLWADHFWTDFHSH